MPTDRNVNNGDYEATYISKKMIQTLNHVDHN